jgi:hypothetical protein
MATALATESDSRDTIILKLGLETNIFVFIFSQKCLQKYFRENFRDFGGN